MKFVAAPVNAQPRSNRLAFSRTIIPSTLLPAAFFSVALFFAAAAQGQDADVAIELPDAAPAAPADTAAPAAQPQSQPPVQPQSQPAAQPQSPRPQGQAVQTPAADDVAGRQLAAFFPVPANSALDGEPLSIDRVLYGVYYPADRFQRLAAYWDLAGKYGVYHLCLTYQNYVNECYGQVVQKYPTEAPPDVVTLANSVKNNAKQRLDSARLQFQQAQYDFDAAFSTAAGRQAALARANASGKKTVKLFGSSVVALYIPSAAPSTEVYQTRFEEIARTRQVSEEAGRLNVLLPLLYETLQSRANQANADLALLKSEFTSTSGTPASLFSAAERYYASQRAAIVAAIRYNVAIAAFSSETTPSFIQGETLLKTLNRRVDVDARRQSQERQTQPTQARPAPAPAPADNQFSWRFVLPGLADESETRQAAYGPVPQYYPPYSQAYPQTNASGYALVLPGLGYDDAYSAPQPTTFANEPARTVAYEEPLRYKVDSLDSVALSPAADSGVLMKVSLPSQNAPLLYPPVEVPEPQPLAPASAEPTPPVESLSPAADPGPAAPEAPKEAPPAAEPAPAEPKADAPAEQAASEPPAEPKTDAPAEPAPSEPPAEQKTDDKPAEQAPSETPERVTVASAEPEQANPNVATSAPVYSAPSGEPKPEYYFPLVITGYEQPGMFQSNVNQTQPPAPSANEPGAGNDGAFWRGLDADALQFFREILTPSTVLADAETEPIVRGQDATFAPAPSTQQAGSYESAQAANAAQAAAEANFDYKRAETVVALYFAPVQPQSNGATGISERAFSLHDAASRIPAYPDARFAVAKTYWELQGAIAAQRVEEIVYSNYLREFNANSNDFIKTRALGAQARRTEAQTKVRNLQIKLLRVSNYSPSYGYPVPTTVPFCGKSFNLGHPQMFNAHMTRSCGLILERLKSAQELSTKLVEPQNTLALNLSTASDMQTAVAALESQRELALSYIKLIVDLNTSIAEYVAFYPALVSNDQFVRALSGKDKE